MSAGVRKPPVRKVKWFLARMGDTLSVGWSSFDGRDSPNRASKAMHRTFVSPSRARRVLRPEVRWLTHTGRHMPPSGLKAEE